MHGLPTRTGTAVFLMTIVNSLGVCAAYSTFIGSTMATLSATPGNPVFDLAPNLTSNFWQICAAALVRLARAFGHVRMHARTFCARACYAAMQPSKRTHAQTQVLPMNALAGNPAFLSSVAYLGAASLLAGVATTCWYGFTVTPDFWGNVAQLPLFTSPQEYFTSFGVVPLLFCVHFAVLSIERNMKNRQDFPSVLNRATIATVVANGLFGALGFAFFGDATDSVVLNNLGTSEFLTWVRLALVVDMMVSYPVMLSSSREICESAVLGSFGGMPDKGTGTATYTRPKKEGGMTISTVMQRLGAIDWADLLTRNAIRSGLILSAFAIAQLNDVGKICNLVGGVFQVVLAFIIPPALAIKGMEVWGRPGTAAGVDETIPLEMQVGFFCVACGHMM